MNRQGRVLVLTGGIATGKSTFLSHLVAALEAGSHALFDCDKEVHRLLTEGETIEKVRSLFGPGVLQSDGSLNRAELGKLVFHNPLVRAQLEDHLHPLVAARCATAQAAFHQSNPEGVFLADVPLYYESKARFPADWVAVVATTEATQRERLRRRSGLGEADIHARVAAQRPIAEKARLADILIWNEGPPDLLREQAGALVSRISSH